MGFEETASRAALWATGGDASRAVDMLLDPTASDAQYQQSAPQSVFRMPSRTDPAFPQRGLSGPCWTMDLGVSQYDLGGGTSACTPIAASVLEHLLECAHRASASTQGQAQIAPDSSPTTQIEIVTETETTQTQTFDPAALTRAITRGVQRYAELPLGSREHLAVDELAQSPGTACGGPLQGLLTSPRPFQALFRQARQLAAPGHVGIVITKPPETVCVLLPPLPPHTGFPAPQYVFFDSHSRPFLGFNGAYVVCSPDEGEIEARLGAIFTPLPDDGSENNWMQQAYNSFEGYVFQFPTER